MDGLHELVDRFLPLFKVVRPFRLRGFKTLLRQLQELLAAFLERLCGCGLKTVIQRRPCLIECRLFRVQPCIQLRILRQQLLPSNQK